MSIGKKIFFMGNPNRPLNVMEYNFDGGGSSNCHAAVSPRGLSDVSLSFWLRATTTIRSDAYGLISGWLSTGGWGGLNAGFVNNGTGFYQVRFRGGSSSANIDVSRHTIGEWVHICFTMSSSTMKCFVDGSLKATLSCPQVVGSNVSGVYRFCTTVYDDSDHYMGLTKGSSFAMSIAFKRALTEDEVRTIYESRNVLSKMKQVVSDAWFIYTGETKDERTIADLTKQCPDLVIEGGDSNRSGIVFI